MESAQVKPLDLVKSNLTTVQTLDQFFKSDWRHLATGVFLGVFFMETLGYALMSRFKYHIHGVLNEKAVRVMSNTTKTLQHDAC